MHELPEGPIPFHGRADPEREPTRPRVLFIHRHMPTYFL
jgi:hypothetical protein